MSFIPEFGLSWWNGFFLAIPFILIRFSVAAWAGRLTAQRADFFPPLIGQEKKVLPLFLVFSYLVILYLPFLSIKVGTAWIYAGLPFYLLGLLILVLSLLDFSKTTREGFSREGLYKISRNPIYVAYFLIYIGMGVMTASWLYLLLALFRQVFEYWIILSEERWSFETFGEPYRLYCHQVRRYLGRK